MFITIPIEIIEVNSIHDNFNPFRLNRRLFVTTKIDENIIPLLQTSESISRACNRGQDDIIGKYSKQILCESSHISCYRLVYLRRPTPNTDGGRWIPTSSNLMMRCSGRKPVGRK